MADNALATLSKSDFKLARTCITKLHYQENQYPRRDDENPYLAMLAEGGYMVEQLARLMYPEGIELEYTRNALPDWDTTRRQLEADHVTLFEATLLHNRLLARVDILVKQGNRFDLIEVKSKSVDGDDIEEGPEGVFRAKVRRDGRYQIRATWIPYLEDVAYQVHVLRQCFPNADIVPHLLVVDKSKTTSVEGMPGMFTIERDVTVNGRPRDLRVRFTGDPAAIDPGEFLTVRNVSSEVTELLPEIAKEAARFAALYDDDGVRREVTTINWNCRDCEFRVGPEEERRGFHTCWGELGETTPHLFDMYKLGSNKFGGERLADLLIREGKTSLFDVDPARLVRANGEPTKDSVRQIRQLDHSRSGTTWLDASIATELGELGWPLHFIDFETSLLAIPYHKGMRPYEKVAFQWSCHTVSKAGVVPEHREWLNTTALWPNLEFATTLREAVGDTGRLLTWTAYEQTVLTGIREQLSRYRPDQAGLVAWLDDVLAHRLYDLHDLCKRGFFHPGMKGKTSIKVVVDALWKSDAQLRTNYAAWAKVPEAISADVGPYEGLPPVIVAGTELNVADGTGAMRAYQAMLYGAEGHEPGLVTAYQGLLKRYCELDTLAMVLIWDFWKRAAGEET